MTTSRTPTAVDEARGDAVDRLVQAINSHDPHAIAACFTTDYRCERPLRPSLGFTGSDRVRANWTALLADVPDLTAQLLARTDDGTRTWTEWKQSGTRADGHTVTFRGVVLLTVDDGRIDWTRFYLEPVAEADDRADDEPRSRTPSDGRG